MEEPGGCEYEESLAISAREPFLALEVPGVDGEDCGIIFCGVVYVFGVAEGSVGVKEVVWAGGE
jgi:hypothetical protein